METVPEDTDVMLGLEERITVGLEESVTVFVTPEESATVKFDDGVTVTAEPMVALTVPDEIATILVTAVDRLTVPVTVTAGTPVMATLMFDDGVTVTADDGMTLIDPALLPQKSPTEMTWRCEVSGCCTVWTSVAEDGVAGTELWNWTLLANAYLLTREGGMRPSL